MRYAHTEETLYMGELIPEYQRQLEQLQRNAAALVEREQATMRAEFASIDRAAAIRASNHSKPRATLAPPTIHDLCANNPLMRKLIRDMQR
jgi:hypothetical protein